MPALLLGGIYSGAFTPTEAAAVSALYALLLAVFGYRTLGLRALFEVVESTARTTAVVTIILGGAFIFNYVVTVEQMPREIFRLFGSLDLSAAQFLLVINVLYLILGAFLEVSTIMLVITPLFIPTAAALGIDLVHFGVVLVFNMMIGLITPPYGVLLFIIKALNGVPLGAMIREIWPFVLVLVALLMLITYVPALVLWIPHMAQLG
jgi:tripartite ATP-independent transporter DctM subunit